MPELHSEGAKVGQEAHDQAPLDPGGIHVDALGHEDEVWGGTVKESISISHMKTGLFSGQRQVTGKAWLCPLLADSFLTQTSTGTMLDHIIELLLCARHASRCFHGKCNL